MFNVMGLNSGSSFDGIDGYPTRSRFIAGTSYDRPEAVTSQGLPLLFQETINTLRLAEAVHVLHAAQKSQSLALNSH
jgi:hypothetical protein